MPELLRIGNGVGTAPVYIDDDRVEKSVAMSVRHPYEVYLSNNKYGRIKRAVRRYPMTAEEAGQKFKDDTKFSETLKNHIKDDPDETHWFIQIMEYRQDRDEKKEDVQNMPVEIRYYEENGDHYLDITGAKTWPMPIWIVGARYDEPYGTCPTDIAMPLILVANQIQKDLLIAEHRAIAPPIQAHKSLIGKINRSPDGVTVLRNMEERYIEAPIHANIPIVLHDLQLIQDHIRRLYKTDHFMMLTGDEKGNMTAREVMERKAEKVTVVGSTVGRLTRVLEQILDRIDQIADDAGRMPEMPESMKDLDGSKLKFEFLGPLAQYQKQMVEAQGVLQAVEMSRIIFELQPESTVNIDWDESIRAIFKTFGAADRLIDKDKVAEIKKAIEEARKAQMQSEQMVNLGKAMPGIAKGAEAEGLMEQIGGKTGGGNGRAVQPIG